MLGTTVSHYRIVELLGSGGMGEVYRAEDTLLGRSVALKFLPESVARDGDRRERFIREARAASALNHPNIITVYEIGKEGENYFIAMEYVPGAPLGKLIAARKLDWQECLKIARQLADAMTAAHEHGIVHRDLKPDNIIVMPDGRAKILDFGVAKLLESGSEAATAITATGIVGTLAYMSPEQALGQPADQRSDIFSFGSVLYHALTGRTPFAGKSAVEVHRALLEKNPEPVSSLIPGLPQKICRVVARSLEKEPSRRYAHFREVRADLDAIDGQKPTAEKSLGRRATMVLLALVAGAVLFGMWLRPRLAVQRAIPNQKYLAVLPFKDLSGQPQGQLFGDGLAETISARLAKISGIQVMPPSAATQSALSDKDLRRVAQHLGANLVLRGAVQRAGDRLRITYSLVNAQGDVQIAGDTVDGSMADIFAMEDRLAASVVTSLRLQAAVVPATATRAGLRDAPAQDRYLQAVGYLQRYENEASVDGAITLLEQLTATAGESALLHAALGRAYLLKYNLTLERSWADRAVAACERALQLDPGSPEVQVTLGNVRKATGRYADAIGAFEQALKGRPDNPDALLGLAEAYESAGKLTESEQAYRQAIALRPSFWGGYNKLGILYFNQGQYARAVEVWRRVVELTPDNPRGYSNLGGTYFRMGRFEEAIAAYNRSIGIQPNASAYSSLGAVHFFLGKYVEAVAAFEKGVGLSPSDPFIWGNLGDAYRWTPGLEEKAAGAFDRAITLTREQLQVNPNDAEAVARLAEWLAKRGNAREAVQVIQRALRLGPKNVNCMARAIYVYHLVGNRPQALKWLERAVNSGYGVADLERDPELATLRLDPTFQKIVNAVRQNKQARS